MPYKDADRQRAFQRSRCAETRAASFVGKTCEGCGSTESLEWHHLDPAEKVTHKIWSFAFERRQAELAKCVPLCVACHKAVTARQRRAAAIARNPHGTRCRYDLGCRCGPCSHAKRDYNRAHPTRAA